jgi:predicted flap endonuclease-1-like 5' DNA nuclease
LGFFALAAYAVAAYPGPAAVKLLALATLGVFAYAQIALLRAAPAGPAQGPPGRAPRAGRERQP